ncbi:pentapeptide repeat-containing protein [Spirillospora sp. CA-142024]|uniref:pentapeptide repeat-containing protein n=1 Tax=Spirillospora sp. CA-142024 TaxID=3240036 RepID=UPI003D8ADF37
MTRLRRRGQYELARPVVRGMGAALAGLGLAVLAVVYAIALWRMPDWMHQHDPKDRHNARLLVVSAGGAIVVAVSLLYTARSYRLSHRGQVTDRFTKALERLSSTDIDARLGGIHALAHVAADSRPHHDDVVEVLEAFVRRRAPRAHRDDGPTLAPRPRLPEWPDSDVQAALTALGRRPQRPERRTLDLSVLHLAGARLAGMDLSAVELRLTNLAGANLAGANLKRANLVAANLSGAKLEGATLVNAFLMSVDLTSANLEGADLRGTGVDGTLGGANLRGADLRGAGLGGVHLSFATLVRANLKEADLRGARLWNADLSSANLKGANLQGADLMEAYLWGADLAHADLAHADLRDAILKEADLRGADLTHADLRAADLRGADLREVTGPSEQEIRAVVSVDEYSRF